ncbi:hypothetical protein [Methanobacterium sp.]|uniref:hypothetical protein n=1 Tax=Methanobacterium sp. TaxID=2164 RepID=UPI0025EB115E|nr:hypothetical protein [Methanobacterium sp.]MBI5458765.1 hypothetical protein [Methanobacterium sp.]MDY9923203.1 hypothetical protein [Methanobacterium sp.]
MKQAFVIMQIGNTELDSFYDDILVPTLKTCDLEVKRVDKHNEGNLLKSEIVNFIKSSDIILADLTNERPNCYLEVGYTMGLNKFKNLILIAKEDHLPESPNFQKEGPKIHFDLIGYDIIFWDPNDLNEFKIKLEKQIKKRLKLVNQKKENSLKKNVIEESKEYIKENKDVNLHELVKKQLKTIETQWFELYPKIDEEYIEKRDNNVLIDGLNVLENYTDKITSIGLTLIEYPSNYTNEFLKILQNIHNLPDILFEDQGDYSWRPPVRYLPHAALFNIYCCLGACAIKNERFEFLGKLIKIEMVNEDNPKLSSKTLWLTESVFYPSMFSPDNLEGIFNFLYESYNYKEFLNEFFRSKEEFLKYLCQFSLILSLYCFKMKLKNPEENYWMNPVFSNYSGYDSGKVMTFLLRIKNDNSFASDFSENAFGEKRDIFIENYPFRCKLINDVIEKTRTSIFSIDPLPCDIFNSK